MLGIIGALIAAYAVIALAVFLGQRKLLFPAPRSGAEPIMEGSTLNRFQGPSGRTVYAFHVPAPPDGRTVVHFHGNGEELADLVPMAWSFRRAGLGFFAVEYPGYGLAKDYPPSEEALYADAEAALWHLHNGLGVESPHVVLEGQSIGTGVAVEMAVRGHGARLVLISPFTSIPDMAAETIPVVPVRWLIRDQFANLEKAPKLSLPVLLVHGTEDEVVPFSMGEQLSKAFTNATLFKVQGGHHNDLFVKDGRLIVDRVAAFASLDDVGRP